MQRFLRAKHWQLFSLLVGLPIVFYIFMFGNMIAAAASGNVANMFGVFKFFPLLMVLVMGVQFGWFWSVGVGLQYKVPEAAAMKVKKFKIFFFIPIIYLLLLMCFVFWFFSSVDLANPQSSGLLSANDPTIILMPILFIMPLHLFAMFCIFYCLYFVAKTLKTVEMQKEVAFGDFVGEFFLIWFYFIGIWFVQPRINKIVEQDQNHSNTSEFETT